MGVVSMASEATKLKQIDWRRKPLSEDESRMTTGAFIKAQRFLTGMKSIADRYASGEAKFRLRDTIVPIILNAWDGYLSDSVIAIDQNDEAVLFAQNLGIEWREISNAVDALFDVGVLLAYHHENPERPGHPNYTVKAADGLDSDLKGLKGRVLNHSRELDVHTWSDHPKANAFVNQIWDAYFSDGNEGIRKKHIKVVLLDLYVRWCTDPTLKITVARRVSDYKARWRYNALHISKLTIDVVDKLELAGLIHQAIGFYNHDDHTGRTTRIWPAPKLISMFEDAKFGIFDIGQCPDREVIILNRPHPTEKKKTVKVDYEDTTETMRMRTVVRRYNDLLHRTSSTSPRLKNRISNSVETPAGQRRSSSSPRTTNSPVGYSIAVRSQRAVDFLAVGGSAAQRNGARTSSSTTSQRWKSTIPVFTSPCCTQT